MDIHIYNRQKDLPLDKASVRALVKELVSYLNISHSEICIYFVSCKEICRLHLDFFQDETPTDCISFPLDEEHLGEIFVCPRTAIEYAQKKKLDPYQETALYVVHGILHLLGYDDLDAKSRRAMRKKEKSCMDHLYTQSIKIGSKWHPPS